MTINWVNTCAGFLVGVLVGLTGVGGGSLMTPILILVFGIAPSMAVGTDLWFAAITKIVGGYVHGKKGAIDWQILRRLFLGSLPAAAATLAWLHSTGIGQGRNRLMTLTLGITLVLTSLASVFRARLNAMGVRLRETRAIDFESAQPALTVLAGVILGFLVTFTSVGAGALGAVMLLYLYPQRLTAKSLVGTDIVHAIPLTMLAGLGHLWLGDVNGSLLLSLVVGSIPGIIVGALASSHAPDKLVRTGISVMLALVGVKMILASG